MRMPSTARKSKLLPLWPIIWVFAITAPSHYAWAADNITLNGFSASAFRQGMQFYREGNLVEAELYLETAINWYFKETGNNEVSRDGNALAFLNLKHANILREMKKTDQALSVLKVARYAVTAEKDANPKIKRDILFEIAHLRLNDQGIADEESIKMVLSALTIDKSIGDSGSRNIGEDLKLLTSLYVESGKIKEGIKYHRQLVGHIEKEPDPDPRTLLILFYDLGLFLMADDQLEKARKTFISAREKINYAGMVEPNFYLKLNLQLALLDFREEKYDIALRKMYDLEKAIIDQKNDLRLADLGMLGEVYEVIADILDMNHKFESAEQVLQKKLAVEIVTGHLWESGIGYTVFRMSQVAGSKKDAEAEYRLCRWATAHIHQHKDSYENAKRIENHMLNTCAQTIQRE